MTPFPKTSCIHPLESDFVGKLHDQLRNRGMKRLRLGHLYDDISVALGFQNHATAKALLGGATTPPPSAAPHIPQAIGSSADFPHHPHIAGLSAEPKNALFDAVFQQVNMEVATKMPYDRLVDLLKPLIANVASGQHLQLDQAEQATMALEIADDLLGTGPLEPLLKDHTITDIMVNGHQKVFVERNGRLGLTGITFRDENHLRTTADRIARTVGKSLNAVTPKLDGRLSDGSRVIIVIPPIAIDGTSISIRRFRKADTTLDMLVGFGTMSESMKTFLEAAVAARLNILISGVESSGKTTLLNAISKSIPDTERIITIEDDAELQLRQNHVLRMVTQKETNAYATEIGRQQLIVDAMRMRPDRILLGEVCGGEALTLFQAMNTGIDGSMSTVRANTPREALASLESTILMAGVNLPIKTIRSQIVSAINLIVHVERTEANQYRLSHLTEVAGIENDTILTQDLFYFKAPDTPQSLIRGEYVCNDINLRCMEKLRRFGLAEKVHQTLAHQ